MSRQKRIVNRYIVTLYYRTKPKEVFENVSSNVFIKDNKDGTKRMSFDDTRKGHIYRPDVLNHTIERREVEL